MISRVYMPDSKQEYALKWYPETDTRMLYLHIKDKSMLVKYVLHAKHKKINKSLERSDWLASEEFEEQKQKAIDSNFVA